MRVWNYILCSDIANLSKINGTFTVALANTCKADLASFLLSPNYI